VATAGAAADQALPEVQPGATRGRTPFADVSATADVGDLIEMRTGRLHRANLHRTGRARCGLRATDRARDAGRRFGDEGAILAMLHVRAGSGRPATPRFPN